MSESPEASSKHARPNWAVVPDIGSGRYNNRLPSKSRMAYAALGALNEVKRLGLPRVATKFVMSVGGTDCAGPDVYTEDGQLGLPITPEMLLSA